jgi:hypothetical protein
MTDEKREPFHDIFTNTRAYTHKAPIEIITPHFHGVAQNFFTLPIHLFIELKQAQAEKTGDELLILMDAAEQAFTDHDMEKLEDLNLTQFIEVMQAWVNASGQ